MNLITPLDIGADDTHTDEPALAAPLNLDAGDAGTNGTAPNPNPPDSTPTVDVPSPTVLVQSVTALGGRIAQLGTVHVVGSRPAFVVPFGDQGTARPAVIGVMFSGTNPNVFFAEHEGDQNAGTIHAFNPVGGVLYPIRRGYLRCDFSTAAPTDVNRIAWMVIASDIPVN